MPLLPARIIHIGIARPVDAVYAYASDPANLGFWASGLASGLTRQSGDDGDEWIGDGGSIGKVRVRFAPPNAFGILDHTVTMENGLTVENPLRVVANGDGTEVMFTLLQRPDLDEAGFEADAAHVMKDLETLKAILEARK